jgi:hypothetical protein
MPRSKNSQSKHNVEVRKIANKLKKQGYEVQADLPGLPKPKTIGGFRPDVVAKKGIKRKIYEVETPDSVNNSRDQQQRKAFKQASDRSKNTTFKRTITDT